MKKNKTYLLLYFLIFQFATTVGQVLHFENVNNTLQIPSLESYKVFQDKKGYLWFATELGFFKYNGVSLKKIDLKSSVANETVYCIWENKNGVMCVSTSKNRLLYLQDDLAKEFDFSHKIRKLLSIQTQKKEIIYQCIEDNYNNLIINSNQYTYLYNYKTKRVRKAFVNDKEISLQIISDKKIAYVEKNNFANIPFVKNDTTKLLFNNKIQQIKLTILNSRIKYLYTNYQSIKIGEIVFFSIGNLLYHINAHGKVSCFEMPNLVLSLYGDTEKGLYVGLLKKGLYHFKKINDLKKPTVHLPEYSVSNILVDSEKTLWCTTLEKGIFKAKNLNIVKYTLSEDFKNHAMVLKKCHNKAIFISNLDKINLLLSDTIIENKQNFNNTVEFTDAIYHNEFYYLSNKLFTVRTKDFSNFEFLSNLCTYGFCKIDNRLFSLSIGNIYEIKGKTVIPFCKDDRFDGTCMTSLGKTHLLVGTKSGMIAVSLTDKKASKIAQFNWPVSAFLSDNNKVWIGTKGAGLFLFENNSLIPYSKKPNLRSTYITDITLDHNKVLWASSTQGIFKIINNSNHQKVHQINTQNGIVDNYCHKICAYNNRIYVSSSEGLFSFSDTTTFSNKARPKFYLDNIIVNGNNNVGTPNNLNLAHHQNQLTFQFDILSFKDNENQIAYKLSPVNTTFKTTQQRKIYFENLPAGNYTLTSYALNSDHVKSKNTIVVKFTIRKPFWATTWFLIILILTTSLVVYLIVQRIITKIKKKEKEKTQINKLIAESQLKALKAQMDPHFIFNAINSIQKYVLNNQKEEAYHYLTKFSKLIRIVLQNSEKQFISLKEEVELLQLYINIEKLRFDCPLDYKINIEDAIDLEHYCIPTMLLQPYVENAIWHGLLNLEGKRDPKLSIKIKVKHNTLKITIKDNGIGRELANSYKKDNYHNSLGTSIGEKRIDLLKRTNEYSDISIQIIDLYFENEAIGTKVVLNIPINLF